VPRPSSLLTNSLENSIRIQSRISGQKRFKVPGTCGENPIKKYDKMNLDFILEIKASDASTNWVYQQLQEALRNLMPNLFTD
jgi:hypothetical protein